MAYGELALKPWEFRILTPQEFYLLWDGYIRRQSDLEEATAFWVTQIVNYCSFGLKQAVSIETVLGRPLRANLDAGLAKKDAQRRAKAEGQ